MRSYFDSNNDQWWHSKYKLELVKIILSRYRKNLIGIANDTHTIVKRFYLYHKEIQLYLSRCSTLNRLSRVCYVAIRSSFLFLAFNNNNKRWKFQNYFELSFTYNLDYLDQTREQISRNLGSILKTIPVKQLRVLSNHLRLIHLLKQNTRAQSVYQIIRLVWKQLF